MNPVRVRPSYEKRHAFSDAGDIALTWKRPRCIVEVKRMSRRFTCAADYPFDSILINECYKHDKVDAQFYCYFIFNQGCTAAVIVHHKTRPLWAVEKRDDLAFTGRTNLTNYTIKPTDAVFLPTPSHLIPRNNHEPV